MLSGDQVSWSLAPSSVFKDARETKRHQMQIIDSFIAQAVAKKAPASVAKDYRQGYLLMRDVLPRGVDSKAGKIEDAREHLYAATTDPVIRQQVEGFLTTLENNPNTGDLTILQFEGIAHRIVKQYSGNSNAYKEYKDRLDCACEKVYPGIRQDVLSLQDTRSRLKSAMLFAGIGNLMDIGQKGSLMQIAADFGIQIDLAKEISAVDLMKLLRGAVEKVREEDLLIGEKEADDFMDHILSAPGGEILYFTDNHGEIVLDQLVVEQLLASGYEVAVIAKGETVRDDVTFEEALAIFQQNEIFKDYLASGKLQILSSGSWILGTDLDQITSQPLFLEAWLNARAYIAKGSGNALSLLGQKLSLAGLHIRMMKNVSTAYDLLHRVRGVRFTPRSPYEMAFTYQARSPDFALPDTMRIYPERLVAARNRVGMTKTALAKKLGVDLSLVSRWESGARVPTRDRVNQLARVLGVTTGYLLGVEDVLVPQSIEEVQHLTFSEKLKRLRMIAGFSQSAFAGKLNYSKSIVSLWESGKRLPPPERIPEIAQLLRVSADELFEAYPLPVGMTLKFSKVKNKGEDSFPTRLERSRIAAGFTQESLAQELNVRAHTIYYWEKGERTPALDAFPRLARVLGVPVGHLLELYPLPRGMIAVYSPTKDSSVESLAVRLSRARKKAALTQEAVAAALGVSANIIYYWEKGERTPTLDKISQLAQVFGCSVDYLLEAYPFPAKISVIYDPTKTAKVDSLSVRLEMARKESGLSQSALARKLGHVPSLVSLWESGDRLPPLERIPEIAQALGVGANYLLEVYPLVDGIHARFTPQEIEVVELAA